MYHLDKEAEEIINVLKRSTVNIQKYKFQKTITAVKKCTYFSSDLIFTHFTLRSVHLFIVIGLIRLVNDG